VEQGELDETDENMLLEEIIFSLFKMLSFTAFELLDVQSHFQLNETGPQSVQMTVKFK